MEAPRPERSYIAVPTEVHATISAAHDMIRSMRDVESIAEVVAGLNAEFADINAIGGQVKIISDYLVVTSRGVNKENTDVTSVYDPEALDMRAAEGVFMGCETIILNGQQTLVYMVEMPLDTETMRFRSVVAPTAESVLFVENPETAISELDLQLAEQFAILRKYPHIVSEADLDELEQLVDKDVEVDADFLRELGVVATRILMHPQIRTEDEVRTALYEIIGLQIDESVPYFISGEEFELTVLEGMRKISVTEVDAECTIYGIASVNDYEVDLSEDTPKLLRLEDYSQPVLVMQDENRKEHYIPLKSVKMFRPTELTKAKRCLVPYGTRIRVTYPH